MSRGESIGAGNSMGNGDSAFNGPGSMVQQGWPPLFTKFWDYVEGRVYV